MESVRDPVFFFVSLTSLETFFLRKLDEAKKDVGWPNCRGDERLVNLSWFAGDQFTLVICGKLWGLYFPDSQIYPFIVRFNEPL